MENANKPKNCPASTSRRDLLRYALGSAVFLAASGCGSSSVTPPQTPQTQPTNQAPKAKPKTEAVHDDKPKPEIVDRKTPFVKQWHEAVTEGIQKFEASYGISLSPENVTALTKAIRDFDPSDYIDTLAKKAGIPPKAIGGEIKSFNIVMPSQLAYQFEPMASVDRMEHMILRVGEWMTYRGKIHEPTIRAILRHEMAHMFSFDYSKAEFDDQIPFTQEGNISPILYEGMTEIVARMGTENPNDMSLEQGYRHEGAVLSAFVLSELLGRNDFLKAYLTRDTKLLKELFETRIGEGSFKELTMPVITDPIHWLDGLHLLHNAFESKHVNNGELEKILSEAQRQGIQEHAMHFRADGSAITTHLFTTNDADAPPNFELNAVLSAPSVYCNGKQKSKSGGHYRTEKFGILVVNKTETTLKVPIDTGVEDLKAHCFTEDSNEITIFDASTIIGYDHFVEERLKKLSQLKPGSQEFESIWREINTHMVKLLTDTAKIIYTRAGVSSLIVNNEE